MPRPWCESILDSRRAAISQITGFSTPLTEFNVSLDGKNLPATEVLADGRVKAIAEPDKMEHVVPIEWAETVPEDKAIDEPGLFGNRNTVCAPKVPKWRTTIDRLQWAFPRFDAV